VPIFNIKKTNNALDLTLLRPLSAIFRFVFPTLLLRTARLVKIAERAAQAQQFTQQIRVDQTGLCVTPFSIQEHATQRGMRRSIHLPLCKESKKCRAEQQNLSRAQHPIGAGNRLCENDLLSERDHFDISAQTANRSPQPKNSKTVKSRHFSFRVKTPPPECIFTPLKNRSRCVVSIAAIAAYD